MRDYDNTRTNGPAEDRDQQEEVIDTAANMAAPTLSP
jgi:hypothetical protein